MLVCVDENFPYGQAPFWILVLSVATGLLLRFCAFFDPVEYDLVFAFARIT